MSRWVLGCSHRSRRCRRDRRRARGVRGLVLVVRLVPRRCASAPTTARQRGRRVGWSSRCRRGPTADAGLAVELIRALHPRAASRLRCVARRLAAHRAPGRLARWLPRLGDRDQPAGRGPRHGAAARPVPGVAIERSSVRDQPPAAVAIGRLDGSGRLAAAGGRLLPRRASSVRSPRRSSMRPAGAEVRLRCVARPVPPDAWRRRRCRPGGRESRIDLGPHRRRDRRRRPAPSDRRAHVTGSRHGFRPRNARPRPASAVASSGFDVGLHLEVAGITPAAAEALLWRLVHFTAELDDGRQAIRWSIRRGRARRSARGEARRLGARPAVVAARRLLRSRRGSRARARSGPRRRCRGKAWASSSARAAVGPWRCPPTPSPAISRSSARRARARAPSCSTSCSPWRSRRSGRRSSIPTAI